MKFRCVEVPSLKRRLSNIMAAPPSAETAVPLPTMLDEYIALGGDGLHLHGEGGETRSREDTGRWLRDRGARSRMFLSTLIGHEHWDEQTQQPIRRLDAACLAEDISENLGLLDVEYLDFVYLAVDDPAMPAGELLEPLVHEQQRGRIRSFGVSQWRPARIEEANRWARSRGVSGISAVVTTELALATPNEPLWPEYVPFDSDLLACVMDEQLAVLAWVSDLNQGLCLFGQSDPVSTMRPSWVSRWQNPRNDEIVARVNQFAAQQSLDARLVNSAYVLNQPFPVIGMVALGVPHSGDLATYARASRLEISETERRFLECGAAGMK